MPEREIVFLKMAARLACRGHGGAEPNPMVGCIIVSPAGKVVGWGYHRKCGGAHAEVVALQRASEKARGAVLYCTLEPCDHTGRTGPCTQAIISAGIAKVVIARRDPNPVAAGGMARLQNAGIKVEVNDRCEEAIMVSDPFAHRVRSGLPWVTVKWAQTIDGKIATRAGQSKWISNEASRALVHRERGRVDAILTGIGTVKADDPMLTARGRRVRRIARRIVIDPLLEIPTTAKLVATASAAPTTIVCGEPALADRAAHAKLLRDLGVEVVAFPMVNGTIALSPVLRDLARRHDITHVLVEAGTGLMTGLFQQKLVNEAWVFTAPKLLGDDQAQSPMRGTATQLTDGVNLKLLTLRRRGGDVIARYRVS